MDGLMFMEGTEQKNYAPLVSGKVKLTEINKYTGLNEMQFGSQYGSQILLFHIPATRSLWRDSIVFNDSSITITVMNICRTVPQLF